MKPLLMKLADALLQEMAEALDVDVDQSLIAFETADGELCSVTFRAVQEAFAEALQGASIVSTVTFDWVMAAPAPAQGAESLRAEVEADNLPSDGTCRKCGCAPRNSEGYCATCVDERDNAALTQPQGAAQAVAVAWLDVMAERRRQIAVEGWTPEHDDSHERGEMALAAAAYAVMSNKRYLQGNRDIRPEWWPWESSWWKPTDRRRDLVKSGALILAEIERLDRAHPPATQEGLK